MASTSPTPKRMPSADVFRNEHGAFDLPSILVGVVVVGILTAGVLAAIFGVIPFAQDKGAEQDLDSVRTAQGVAKAKDGRFDTSDVLSDRGYLKMPGNVAAVADGPGSCYVAVSRSGSGKTFIASSLDPKPVQLTEVPADTCIPVEQIRQLVEKVGGTWPGADEPETGGFQPIMAGPNVSVAGAAFMNADLAFYAAPETLAYMGGDPSVEDAFMAIVQTYMDARLPLQQNIEESWDITDLLNRTDSGIPALKQASATAINEFNSDPTAATQEAAVFALHALYQGVADAPHQEAVRLEGAAYTPIPVTNPDLAGIAEFANTQLAFESSQLELYSAWSIGTSDRYDNYDMQEASNLTAAGQAWNAVKGQDQMFGRILVQYRTDAGIPALLQAVDDTEATYQIAMGEASIEQMASYQQDYIDALRALYAVTSSTPCPAGGCPTGHVW